MQHFLDIEAPTPGQLRGGTVRPNLNISIYAGLITRYGPDSEEARKFKEQHTNDPQFTRLTPIMERMMRVKTQAVELTAPDTDMRSLFHEK